MVEHINVTISRTETHTVDRDEYAYQLVKSMDYHSFVKFREEDGDVFILTSALGLDASRDIDEQTYEQRRSEYLSVHEVKKKSVETLVKSETEPSVAAISQFVRALEVCQQSSLQAPAFGIWYDALTPSQDVYVYMRRGGNGTALQAKLLKFEISDTQDSIDWKRSTLPPDSMLARDRLYVIVIKRGGEPYYRKGFEIVCSVENYNAETLKIPAVINHELRADRPPEVRQYYSDVKVSQSHPEGPLYYDISDPRFRETGSAERPVISMIDSSAEILDYSAAASGPHLPSAPVITAEDNRRLLVVSYLCPSCKDQEKYCQCDPSENGCDCVGRFTILVTVGHRSVCKEDCHAPGPHYSLMY